METSRFPAGRLQLDLPAISGGESEFGACPGTLRGWLSDPRFVSRSRQRSARTGGELLDTVVDQAPATGEREVSAGARTHDDPHPHCDLLALSGRVSTQAHDSHPLLLVPNHTRIGRELPDALQYQRRTPETTVLYRVAQRNLETFIAPPAIRAEASPVSSSASCAASSTSAFSDGSQRGGIGPIRSSFASTFSGLWAQSAVIVSGQVLEKPGVGNLERFERTANLSKGLRHRTGEAPPRT